MKLISDQDSDDIDRNEADPSLGEFGADVDDDPQGVDLWIMPYIEDSTLWPVLIVVIVHVVAFVAPVVLFAIRDRSYASIFAIAWLLFLSFKTVQYELRRWGRPRALTWIVVITWALSAAGAYFGNLRGFL